MTRLHRILLGVPLMLLARLTTRRDERGDVPGWVLIVVMSAGIVAVLYGIARTELSQMLRDALNSVR